MKKPEYNSITLDVVEGKSTVPGKFSRINGKIVGISTHVIGTRAAASAKLAIMDGGQEVQRPVDIAFTETDNRGSFKMGVMPVEIENPGNITVSLSLDTPVAANGDFKVEVLLISEVDGQGSFCN